MSSRFAHRETRVYVAGRLNGGDVAANIRAAIDVADDLWRGGFLPFLPHQNKLWHLVHPHPEEKWLLDFDLPWLAACDVLVRLPGESPGADREVAEAELLGIPVVLLTPGGSAAAQVREALR